MNEFRVELECSHEFYPYGSVFDPALYCRRCAEVRPLPLPSKLRLSLEPTEEVSENILPEVDRYDEFKKSWDSLKIVNVDDATACGYSKGTFYRYRKRYMEELNRKH